MRRPRKPRDPFGKASDPFGKRRDPFAKGYKQPDPPAPRNYEFERLLCSAIEQELLVLLRYDDDRDDRLFEPSAVYHSTQDKVLVSGVQIDNPADPRDRHVPRNFEVGRLSRLTITDTHFKPDPRFDRFAEKFQNGIICCIKRI